MKGLFSEGERFICIRYDPVSTRHVLYFLARVSLFFENVFLLKEYRSRLFFFVIGSFLMDSK